MPATFFIGDPHLFHEKVSLIRGFSTVEDHNAFIVRKWLRQVSTRDHVIVMGDCSGGKPDEERKALELIKTLPGHKRLILGNHDSESGVHNVISPNRDLFHEAFEKVSDFGRIQYNKRRILLSHYPYSESQDGPGRGMGRYHQFRLPNLGHILIHAHTHWTHPTTGSATGREICVSWDAWKRIVDMGDIAQLVNQIPVTPQEELIREMEHRSRRERYAQQPSDDTQKES